MLPSSTTADSAITASASNSLVTGNPWIMGPNTSLFSRARPGKVSIKKVRGFLALPGEVRNMVYKYYFQPDVRCEFASRGHQFMQPERPTVKLQSNVLATNRHISKNDSNREGGCSVVIRISRALGKYNAVQGLRTNWLTSVYALNLACRQIHAETLPLLYNKTVFVFASSRRIANFLDVISNPMLQNITKLQLHYTTYGAPTKLEDAIWQDKHTDAWTQAMKTASKTLLNLEHLEVLVYVSQFPLHFDLHEQWVGPLLQFRRLTRPPKLAHGSTTSDLSTQEQKKLKIAHVHIQSLCSKLPLAWFNGNAELARACLDLHHLFGQSVSFAILGANEVEAMAEFNTAWRVKYRRWQYHLGFAKIGW
ncbi:Nn.00g100300.m01.CDS01 [Neocucurbitaria sp. VM-36]